MRRVLHLGPSGSQGGMSTVMQNMVDRPPVGWEATSIDTYGEKKLRKITRWIKSRSELRNKIESGEVDLVHIHVTHSFSWWRKSGLLKICEKYEIPTVVHIHSGKFDSFCTGVAGKSVKKRLASGNVKTLVLEKRWIELLDGIIPYDSEILSNSSLPICDREGHQLKKLSLIHI